MKIAGQDGKPTRMYRKWSSMHRRCVDAGHPAFYRYGGRGIYVCIRWSGKEGFTNFCLDMGECPEGLTLDRKNSDGNYESENCRWSTWKEQAANRKHGGPPRQPESMRGLARSSGLPYHVVYQRIAILGWSKERALTTPVEKRAKRVSVMELIEAEESPKVLQQEALGSVPFTNP